MGKLIRAVFLLFVFSCASAGVVKADTLTYDLTGPYGFNLTFNIQQDPSFTSTSFGYIVPVTGLTIGSFSINNLDFFKSSSGGGLGYTYSGTTYQLTGSQLYNYTSGSLVLSTGDFTLNAYGTPLCLTVTDGPSDPTSTPEPSTLLLLGSGLAGAALFIRRKPTTN